MNAAQQQGPQHQMLIPHMPRPATDEALKDYGFITKVRDKMFNRVPAYRGPKLDNWMTFKRKMVIAITSSLHPTEDAEGRMLAILVNLQEEA